MDFATAKAGRMPLQFSHVVLRDAAEGVLAPLKGAAEAKRIEVELSFEA
jgi:hypothetical protein